MMSPLRLCFVCVAYSVLLTVSSEAVLPLTFVLLRVVRLQISCVNLFGSTELI